MNIQYIHKNANFATTKRPENATVFHLPFTGKEKDSESGYYYFGARYFMPNLSIWNSVDPMADKYPSLSPYNYCAWNPMKLVDPDGEEMDDWEVDKWGYITRCKEQPQNSIEDRIRVKGTKGWTNKNSISGLSLGTITEQRNIRLGDDVGDVMFMGGNQEDRINVFKFCADNANVEFSLMEFENMDGTQHNSLLTTSHDERSTTKEKIGDIIGSRIAIRYATTLRLHLHNHFGNGELGWGASKDDISFKNSIVDIQNTELEVKPFSTQFGIYKCRGNDRQIIYY